MSLLNLGLARIMRMRFMSSLQGNSDLFGETGSVAAWMSYILRPQTAAVRKPQLDLPDLNVFDR